jgi:hypothetical protein
MAKAKAKADTTLSNDDVATYYVSMDRTLRHGTTATDVIDYEAGEPIELPYSQAKGLLEIGAILTDEPVAEIRASLSDVLDENALLKARLAALEAKQSEE